ncbi:MAG: ABC transporter ATP-binding protein [Planctomycetia bacterium]|nr:ABC transporter ATP-binding protein [Planctomycetia bacterium]
MSSLAISCRQLVKRYDGKPPVEAVRGVDLEVRTGECFGLLGPNGAGKTTTMEILEGLLDATASEKMEVLGLEWGRDDETIRNRIGISLQETRLSDKLTVLETVNLFRSFYRSGLEPIEAIRRVSLEDKCGAHVEKLSGGQRQRLAVACAIIGDPELLFLDEPTTGLDPHSRRELWEIIRGFKSAGRTVLLTTHYMDEAERLCDRVAVVDQGQVIALGTPVELIARLGGQHIVDFSLSGAGNPLTADEVQALPSVQSVRLDGGNFTLSVTEPHVALPGLMNYLQQTGREFATLTTRHATLEDVFVTLTGRHLQEGEEAA